MDFDDYLAAVVVSQCLPEPSDESGESLEA